LAVGALIFLSPETNAQIRDRVESVREADPVVVSGKVGTHLGLSYNSLQPNSTPFSSTLYANLNLSFYSFELPFSFYLTNNTTSFDYPQMPTLSLGFTPTWNRFRLHVGSSSMHFSNYTYSGLQFLGLGAEYQGKVLRAAAFGGLLNQATKIRGYDDRTAFQRLRDSLLGLNVPEGNLPQYRRNAYGVKLGLGSERNFIDFSLLKAEDAEKTLPEEWRDSIRQKENLALGLSGRISIGKWVAFTANIGASLYTDNKQDKLLDLGENTNILTKLEPLYGVRTSSILRFAGDAAVNFNTKAFGGSLSYRFIQPDYVSLGAGYFSQNSQSVGATTNFRLFKGRSNLSLIAYGQQDNLNQRQMYTNRVLTYTVNWTDNPCDWFSFNANYNGIKQNMLNGTCIAPDSIRIDQIAHTLSISPVFTISGRNTHDISLNFNYVQNANLNRAYYIPLDIKTTTFGLGYDITIEDIKLGLNASYDYSQSRAAEIGNCNTHSIGYGCNYSILSDEKKDLSVNYNGSVGYNIQLDEGVNNNFSISNSLGGSFSLNRKHNASLYLSLSNYSDNVIIGQRIATDLDLRLTFSYSYSFGKELIKKKSKEQKLAKRASKLEKKNNR
jgi:hypothetical protein